MAKLTEKEVIEQVKNLDISFLDRSEDYLKTKQDIDTYHKESDAINKKFPKIEAQYNLDNIPFDGITIKKTTEAWDEGMATEMDIDYFNVYIDDYELPGNMYSYDCPMLARDLNEFIKKYEEYSHNVKSNPELQEHLVEYNFNKEHISKTMDELNATKNPFKRNKIKKELKRLKTVEALIPEVHKYKNQDLIYMFKFAAKNYEKTYKKAKKIVAQIEKIIEEYKAAAAEYNEYNHGQKRKYFLGDIKYLQSLKVDAMQFMLAKYVRDNEHNLEDVRKPLVKTLLENVGEEYMIDFPKAQAAYYSAIDHARENEKLDFGTLSIDEQFERYELARAIVREFDYLNGKEDAIEIDSES